MGIHRMCSSIVRCLNFINDYGAIEFVRVYRSDDQFQVDMSAAKPVREEVLETTDLAPQGLVLFPRLFLLKTCSHSNKDQARLSRDHAVD